MTTVKKKVPQGENKTSTKVKETAAKATKKTNGKAIHNKVHSVDIYAAISKQFGFDAFKGTQEPVINNLLNGKEPLVMGGQLLI